ncbi:MAG: hypothetical protein AABY22_10165, partial [Nanoarchaeota archaeon]
MKFKVVFSKLSIYIKCYKINKNCYTMDLNSIKSKLAGLQNKNTKGEKREKIDYSLYLWKPKAEGKYQIRFVDSVYDKSNPFKEVFVHYGFGKFPIYALTNWGEKDPIVEFSKRLKEGEYDLENWKLSGKLEPKMRVFAPIIVRGEEDKGVRLWEFGKEIYAQLLGIAEDEDYGDFTDVSEGRDFTLTATKADFQGRAGLKSTIQIKPKQSPLSTDAELVEKWLNEQPNILEVHKTYKKTFDQLKEVLSNFLTPKVDNEDVEETEEEEEETETKSKNDDLPWEKK